MKKKNVVLHVTDLGCGLQVKLECEKDEKLLSNIIFAVLSAAIQAILESGQSVDDAIKIIGRSYISAMKFTDIYKNFDEFVKNEEEKKAQNEEAA